MTQGTGKRRWYSKVPPDGDSASACIIEEHRTADAAKRAAEAVLEDGSDSVREVVAALKGAQAEGDTDGEETRTWQLWSALGYGCYGRGCKTCFCECQEPDHMAKLLDGAVADIDELCRTPMPVWRQREALLRRPAAALDAVRAERDRQVRNGGRTAIQIALEDARQTIEQLRTVVSEYRGWADGIAVRAGLPSASGDAERRWFVLRATRAAFGGPRDQIGWQPLESAAMVLRRFPTTTPEGRNLQAERLQKAHPELSLERCAALLLEASTVT